MISNILIYYMEQHTTIHTNPIHKRLWASFWTPSCFCLLNTVHFCLDFCSKFGPFGIQNLDYSASDLSSTITGIIGYSDPNILKQLTCLYRICPTDQESRLLRDGVRCRRRLDDAHPCRRFLRAQGRLLHGMCRLRTAIPS